MLCPYCGAQNPDNATLCEYCGEPAAWLNSTLQPTYAQAVSGVEWTAPAATKKKSGSVMPIIAAVIVTVAIISGFFFTASMLGAKKGCWVVSSVSHYYSVDGNNNSKEVFTLDDRGAVIRTDVYSLSTNELQHYLVYEVDDDGVATKLSSYNPDGKLDYEVDYHPEVKDGLETSNLYTCTFADGSTESVAKTSEYGSSGMLARYNSITSKKIDKAQAILESIASYGEDGIPTIFEYKTLKKDSKGDGNRVRFTRRYSIENQNSNSISVEVVRNSVSSSHAVVSDYIDVDLDESGNFKRFYFSATSTAERFLIGEVEYEYIENPYKMVFAHSKSRPWSLGTSAFDSWITS